MGSECRQDMGMREDRTTPAIETGRQEGADKKKQPFLDDQLRGMGREWWLDQARRRLSQARDLVGLDPIPGLGFDETWRVIQIGLLDLDLATYGPNTDKVGHWALICDNCGFEWDYGRGITSAPRTCKRCGYVWGWRWREL